MTTSLKDLRERRGRLVTEMRGLLDAASGESLDLTTEEQSRYDEMFAEQERVGTQIAREERQQDLDRRMAETAAHWRQWRRQAVGGRNPRCAARGSGEPTCDLRVPRRLRPVPAWWRGRAGG
jgi:hypothetical protein